MVDRFQSRRIETTASLKQLDAGPGSPLAPGLARMDSTVSAKSSVSSPRRRCLSLAAIIAYLISGLLIVVINKAIVRDHGLHTPALVSSTGSLFTAILTRALVFFGKVHVKPVERPWEFAFRQALPVGVCAAGSLCFGNMSYIYLDAGFVQMLKAGTPALLLLTLSCLRIEAVSLCSAILALCMVGGSALATVHQPNATAIGLAVQLTSQLCEVLQCTAVQFFLQKLGFEAWDAGYYLAPAVAACCLLPSLVLEWPHVIVNHKVQVLYQQVPLLIGSGVVGIVVNFSSLLVIKFTSSLLAKLLVIARSAALVLLFINTGEDYTCPQVIGYVVTLSAFAGYSVVKAREIEQQDQELEKQTPVTHDGTARESDEDLLESRSPTNSVKEVGTTPWDLTAFMFWFAIFVVIAGVYQATVIGDLSPACSVISRELGLAQHESASSPGLPPTPYLEPVTAGTHTNVGSMGEPESRIKGSHTAGALSVQSSAKVLYLADGRSLLHQPDGLVIVAARQSKDLLSSAWVISSEHYGTIHLEGLDSKGSRSWLSCDLTLSTDKSKACLLWMTASQWDRWSTDRVTGEFVFRRHGGDSMFLAASRTSLIWSRSHSAFHVAEWVPEACPLMGMTPLPHSYNDAKQEVTFTMTSFFHVYARSIMFRQALSSVFMHLKEQEFYVKEFLVVNDWYDGKSLDSNGTFSGPTVEETRMEMVAFFPGCQGVSVRAAKQRTANARCTFIFKNTEERGQPNALNILLDLMVTKYWIHIDDDYVFYQDVYVSRLLEPMYEHRHSCWSHEHQGQLKIPDSKPTTTTSTTRLQLSTTTTELQQTTHVQLDKNSSGAMGRRLGNFNLGDRQRCHVIGGVRLGPVDAFGAHDTFEVETYSNLDMLHNLSYVKELLAHGGFDDKRHGWGDFQNIKAVAWPMFSLKPSLYNLTYIRSIEAPLFYEGRPGHFSEDPNITRWKDDSKFYKFHWDFELEFAVRWARSGAALATLKPGACIRDISNGISSFERSFDYR